MATRSLGQLTLDLLVKTGAFVEGFSKAERESKKFNDRLKKNFDQASKAFIGFVTGATAATAALVQNSINVAAELDDVAQTSGIAVENLSALRYAAELEGIEFGTLSTTLNRFSRVLIEAKDESTDAAQAFAALGVSIRNADGSMRGTQDILLDVADSFSRVEDGAAKAEVAQRLFGKTGADLIPFLNNGRDGLQALADEAERFGLVIGAETAARADEFNDNLFRLKAIIQGTGLQLAESLLPQLVEFSDLIKDPTTQAGIQNLIKGIADVGITTFRVGSIIGNFVGDVRDLTKSVAESLAAQFNGVALDDLQRVPQHILTLQNSLASLREINTSGDAALAASINGRIAALEQEIAAYQEAYDAAKAVRDQQADLEAQLTPVNVPQRRTALPEVDTAAAEAAQKLNDLFADRLADLQKEATLVGEVTELQRIRYDIENGALQGINAAQAEQLQNLAAEIDANEQLTKAAEQRKEAAEEQARADEDFQQMEAALRREIELYGEVTRADELLYEIASGNLQSLSVERAQTLLGLTQQLDALDELAKAEEAHRKELERQQEQYAEFGKEAARGIQREFVAALKGVESNFSETLNNIALEFASSEILEYIGTLLSGSGNSWVSQIGGFFAGAFAGGGDIRAGQIGIVGDGGPEIIMGPASVTSVEDTADILSGTGDMTVNINLPGVRNRDDADQAASSIMRSVRQAIIQSERYA